MKFLKSFAIDLDKVPNYNLFKKPFHVDIDIHLARLILECDDERLTPEIKNEFKKVVNAINKKDNTLASVYSPRYGVGRRYPDQPEPKLPDGRTNPKYGKYHGALIILPRIVKNTIFKYHDYIDIDQRKGHPTIIYCHAEQCGIKIPAYKDYLENFNDYVAEISEYYTADPNNPVDKKDVKLLFNRTIYGGSHDGWVSDMIEGKIDKDDDQCYKREPKLIKNGDKPHPFYVKFHKDTQFIIETVYNKNPKLAEKVCSNLNGQPEWKKKSRTMSYFCGIVENEITYQAYKYLHKEELIYERWLDWGLDGLTLPRFEGSVKSVLNGLNKFVRDKTGFTLVTFEHKEFNDNEILHECIDEREEMIIDDENNDIDNVYDEKCDDIVSFDGVAKKFEESHCKIDNKSIFIKQTSDGFIVMSRSQIVTSCEHMTYECYKEDKDGSQSVTTKNFIKSWLVNNQNQRRYTDMGIYPDSKLCPVDHFNAWIPFVCEKVETYTHHEQGLQDVLNHIRVLCDHDEEVFNYFCKWIGQMLKYPAIKIGVVITLISNEGAGKGFLMYLLKKMMGSKKVIESADPNRDVWGNFNGNMANAFLVDLNELSKKDTMYCDGRIKALVTDPTMIINNKGVNQVEIDSYHRFIITTNNDEPINVKSDSRRHLIIRSSDEKINDKPYFKALYDLADNMDVLKTCYEYFINLDGLDTLKTAIVPVTEHQRHTQEACDCPVKRWFKNFISEHIHDAPLTIYSKELFDEFIKYRDDQKIEFNISNVAFGVKLTRFKLKGITQGRAGNKGPKRTLDFKILAKELNVDVYDSDDDCDITYDDGIDKFVRINKKVV